MCVKISSENHCNPSYHRGDLGTHNQYKGWAVFHHYLFVITVRFFSGGAGSGRGNAASALPGLGPCSTSYDGGRLQVVLIRDTD